MFDTNIYDEISADEDAYCDILKLHHSGVINIFITSVQLNELNAIPEVNYRDTIAAVVKELAPEKITVELAPYGYAYGECYGGISPEATIDSNKFVTSEKHVHDAMIYATASSNRYKIDVVVTEDTKFQAKVKAQHSTTSIMNYADFKDYISGQAH